MATVTLLALFLSAHSALGVSATVFRSIEIAPSLERYDRQVFVIRNVAGVEVTAVGATLGPPRNDAIVAKVDGAKTITVTLTY